MFTKAMGEQILTAERGDVPLAIIRPSIVEGAWQEPFPGWIEGVRMADPLILAYAKVGRCRLPVSKLFGSKARLVSALETEM